MVKPQDVTDAGTVDIEWRTWRKCRKKEKKKKEADGREKKLHLTVFPVRKGRLNCSKRHCSHKLSLWYYLKCHDFSLRCSMFYLRIDNWKEETMSLNPGPFYWRQITCFFVSLSGSILNKYPFLLFFSSYCSHWHIIL